MKTLQNILICFVLAAFLPCVTGAPLQPDSDGDKMSGEWLPDIQKRDLCVPKRSVEDSAELLGQEENATTGSPVAQNSSQPTRRMKRGCNLLTCSVHELAYRMNHISSRMISAPPHKLSPCGYGRRRRRSLPQRPAAPAHGEGLLELAKIQAGDAAHLKN